MAAFSSLGRLLNSDQRSAHLFLGSPSSSSPSLFATTLLTKWPVYLYRENTEVMSCELRFWTPCCKSIYVFQPPSLTNSRLGKEAGVPPSCTHHLLPFHTSLVALFQQPIFFRSLQSVLLRNNSHWGLQQPNSPIKQMLPFFM